MLIGRKVEHDVVVRGSLLQTRGHIDRVPDSSIVLHEFAGADIPHNRLAGIHPKAKGDWIALMVAALMRLHSLTHSPGRTHRPQSMILLVQRRVKYCQKLIPPESSDGALFFPDLFDHDIQVRI